MFLAISILKLAQNYRFLARQKTTLNSAIVSALENPIPRRPHTAPIRVQKSLARRIDVKLMFAVVRFECRVNSRGKQSLITDTVALLRVSMTWRGFHPLRSTLSLSVFCGVTNRPTDHTQRKPHNDRRGSLYSLYKPTTRMLMPTVRLSFDDDHPRRTGARGASLTDCGGAECCSQASGGRIQAHFL